VRRLTNTRQCGPIEMENCDTDEDIDALVADIQQLIMTVPPGLYTQTEVDVDQDNYHDDLDALVADLQQHIMLVPPGIEPPSETATHAGQFAENLQEELHDDAVIDACIDIDKHINKVDAIRSMLEHTDSEVQIPQRLVGVRTAEGSAELDGSVWTHPEAGHNSLAIGEHLDRHNLFVEVEENKAGHSRVAVWAGIGAAAQPLWIAYCRWQVDRVRQVEKQRLLGYVVGRMARVREARAWKAWRHEADVHAETVKRMRTGDMPTDVLRMRRNPKEINTVGCKKEKEERKTNTQTTKNQSCKVFHEAASKHDVCVERPSDAVTVVKPKSQKQRPKTVVSERNQRPSGRQLADNAPHGFSHEGVQYCFSTVQEVQSVNDTTQQVADAISEDPTRIVLWTRGKEQGDAYVTFPTDLLCKFSDVFHGLVNQAIAGQAGNRTSKSCKVGRHSVYLNLRQNGRGKFLKIASTVGDNRTSIVIPEQVWSIYLNQLGLLQNRWL